MKTCVRCNEEKPFTAFPPNNKRGVGYHARCRSCVTEALKEWKTAHPGWEKIRQQKRRDSRRDILIEHLLAHPCVDCGEKNLKVLEFDHIKERGEKSFAIAEFAGNFGIETLHKEIAKCDIRCANCHRKKTAERNPRHWSHRYPWLFPEDKPNRHMRVKRDSNLSFEQLNLFHV